jgi:MoaA/NifB/PqqE/SkfB family radical SAM enzyme
MFFSAKNDHLPIAIRLMGLIKRNPNMLKTFMRTAYRNKVGLKLDQRRQDGYAAPPVRLLINLTRQCNLRCRMCIQGRGEEEVYPWNDPKNQLPFSAWTTLLDQAAGFSPFLSISGGEPTIHPQFREFVVAAKRRGFVFELVTNGTLLTRDADFIVELGIEFVSVSLDGLEEQHDEIRGHQGSFRRAVDGIRALAEARKRHKSYGPVINIGFTIMKSNIDIMDRMIPLAVDLNADTFLFQHLIFDSPEHVAKHNRMLSPEWAAEQGIDMVPPSMPDGEYFQSDVTPDDVKKIRTGLANARKLGGRKIIVGDSPHLSDNVLEPYYLDLDHPATGICNCLWTRSKILPDGSMIPCLHVVGGNIGEKSFMDVWNSGQMRSFRKALKKGFFPACARCCCREF